MYRNYFSIHRRILFTRTRTQGNFLVVVAFVPVIFSQKQTMICLLSLSYHHQFQVPKVSSPEVEPRSVFPVCDLHSRNHAESNSDGLIHDLLPSLFPRHSKYLPRDSNPEQILCLCPLFLYTPCRNPQLWAWRLFSIVLSLRATETTLPGIEPSKFYSSFNFFKISSWSQGTSVPSSVHISISAVDFELKYSQKVHQLQQRDTTARLQYCRQVLFVKRTVRSIYSRF
jgi:hypothetical protein